MLARIHFVIGMTLASAAILLAQSNTGELRIKVTDPSGAGMQGSVSLTSEANQVRKFLATDEAGNLDARQIPFGIYRIEVQHVGFAPFTGSVEIRSAIPTEFPIKLALAASNQTVTVTDRAALIDPYRPGAVNRIGSDTIENRTSSLPGRSLQDLVNSQPGWLYEGNAVLHPRGSEYQTQFVVDGIPLTNNLSPGFGNELEANDVQSMSIYTAGIPAEYGRKMGGVVELDTARDAREGFHGQMVLSGGSFDTAGSFATAQYAWGKNVLGVSADGALTDHYLNPPVPENFTNTGTTGDFSLNYSRDLTPDDQLSMSVRHELARYQIPNEQVQQAAEQTQNADDFETIGIISCQHIFSPDVVADFRGMVRNDANDLWSNALSTPIIAFQNNSFNEGYFKGSVSIHHGSQEWKAGVESDNTFLNEKFSDVITDPSQFDPRTPRIFAFAGNRPDLEQSAFVQDLIHFGRWSVNAGLRWDHYQLLVNKNAFSPRLSVARYFPSADIIFHFSYDRIFQTPSSENILLSSSPVVLSLNPNVLRVAVQPSEGNYYEAGFTKGFFGQFTVDFNYFLRRVNNFADDDQLLDTAVSFPIAFQKGSIYGAESKINLPHWRHFSGYVSYSYMVGSVYFPVTGGLFLGQDAINAETILSGRFWDSQDQRNSLRTRFRYQFTRRLWAGLGGEYGSGLPFDFGGTIQQAIGQYGQAVVNRVNFERGRVKPNLSVDASLGADIYTGEKLKMRMQADGENLNNRLNLIDFAGLFSGNAIAPSRSYSLRLTTEF
jgi:hypothetical protein